MPTLDPVADCPFCGDELSALLEGKAVYAAADGFPVSPGHTLVIPKRHVASVFDLPYMELLEIFMVVEEIRELLMDEFKPDGFTIGINDGEAAGQTVPHAHVHVIPRHKGDVADPRGGVRWVLPEKAKYWAD